MFFFSRVVLAKAAKAARFLSKIEVTASESRPSATATAKLESLILLIAAKAAIVIFLKPTH